MRTILPFILALIFSISGSNTTLAQDYKTLLDIPEGATLVSLSATERIEVEQDLLTANLRYEAENVSPKELQNNINTMMKKALEKAKKVNSVKVSTQAYSVYQYNLNNNRTQRRNMIWKGQQGLKIKGKNAVDLLDLLGDLQEMGLTMKGLSYSVSPELLEKTHNEMLEAALGKLITKAKRTAKAIGKSKTELLQINVNHGGRNNYQPQYNMRAMGGMAETATVAPVAAPGESQITLTVSAQALLRP